MGERLRIAREKLGFHTIPEAARFLGISKSTLQSYEQETRSPGADMLRVMALGYGVSADWLLGIKRGRR